MLKINKMEYKLIEAKNVKDFNIELEQQINEGWLPFGQHFVIPDSISIMLMKPASFKEVN